MPRRSAAALSVLNIDGSPPRLTPPASLSKAEKVIFNDIVNANDARHFRPSDQALLMRYVETVALLDLAAKALHDGVMVNGRASPWLDMRERQIKVLITLGRALRLSPQARQPNLPTRSPVRPWTV